MLEGKSTVQVNGAECVVWQIHKKFQSSLLVYRLLLSNFSSKVLFLRREGTIEPSQGFYSPLGRLLGQVTSFLCAAASSIAM